MARNKKLSARDAIQTVLAAAAPKSVKVPDIIKEAVPMTNLGGKTPGQTIYSVLYADAKKAKGVARFKQVGKGEFKLAPDAPAIGSTNGASKPKATAKAAASKASTKTAAKPDPKPASSRKRAPRKTATASAAAAATPAPATQSVEGSKEDASA